MLAFDGIWDFGEVFSSWMNPGFHCTGQMTNSVYGVVWVSGLLMSTLRIEWTMVAVGLWYGQAFVLDMCILLMAFWMHRDTVTIYWGPLLCPSSTTITSCCSMIIHGPMLQGSVLNSWKLKTSQFLHGQHTHRTCHPLSMFGMLWIVINDSVFPVPANIQQPRTSHLRGVDQHSTGHNQQPDQLYAKEMCCTEWGKWWSHQILTGFWAPLGKPKCCVYHFGLCIYIYIYIYIYVCMYICVYKCVYIYIYIYIHTHTHIYIFIYIYLNIIKIFSPKYMSKG